MQGPTRYCARSNASLPVLATVFTPRRRRPFAQTGRYGPQCCPPLPPPPCARRPRPAYAHAFALPDAHPTRCRQSTRKCGLPQGDHRLPAWSAHARPKRAARFFRRSSSSGSTGAISTAGRFFSPPAGAVEVPMRSARAAILALSSSESPPPPPLPFLSFLPPPPLPSQSET